MTLPISAFIICQDEERFIEACIRSLHMCAEIVVVDSGSSDGTLDLLAALRDEGFPLKVISEPWRGYAGQKQFALEQCEQPWLLSLDSDERVSAKLAAALPGMIADGAADAWRVTRIAYLAGYGFAPPSSYEGRFVRLVRRGKGHFNPADLVHEGITVDGAVKQAAQGGLLHFRPLPLEEQILKENKYSSLKAQMKHERGIAPSPWKMIFNPPLFFLRIFFGRGFWRCGWAGVVRAGTGAVYSFLTEAKRWERAAMERTPPNEPKTPQGY